MTELNELNKINNLVLETAFRQRLEDELKLKFLQATGEEYA